MINLIKTNTYIAMIMIQFRLVGNLLFDIAVLIAL